MNKLTSLLVFIFTCLLINAQTIAGFEAKLKWNQLKSEKSTLIYNPEFEAYAFQAQGIISRLQKEPFNIGKKIKKIKIVLRANSVVSNAYVGLAPFKSAFFLNPSQNSFALGSLPWTYLLSIHEYQHVLQFSNTLYGPTKWAYWFGGDLAWGTIVSITTPNWFFEGDAVRAETEYSRQGRGRIPYFLNGFRQMANYNSNYTYEKARNGSLKDNVPNHYPLGYLMIKHGKEKYGNEFWSTVLKETSQIKSLFYPFSRAIKRNSGLNVKGLYEESLEAFKKDLNPNNKWIIYDEFAGQTRKEIKANKSFNFSKQDPKTKIEYINTASFNEPAHIEKVLTNLNREQVHLLGIRQSNYFDVYNNQILYAAKYVHPRWNLKDYSDLIIYDIESKKLKRITKRNRIFSPNFIQDGNQIVAIEMDKKLIPHLVIYNLDGALDKIFDNSEEYYLMYPKGISENEILVGLRDSLGRTNLSIFNTKEQKYKILLPWTYHQIGIPEYAGDYIYFSASFSGIDHIYRLNIESKELNQVTKGKSSHYQVRVEEINKQVFFQVFNLKGNQIQYLNLDSISNEIYLIEPLTEVMPISFAKEEQFIPVNSEPDDTMSEAYSKSRNLLNFHSWTVSSIDPEYEFALLSENILGTFSTRIGSSYNRNENGLGYFANFSYSQYFPVFTLGFSNQKRSALARDNKRYYWNETETASTISIPLDFSSKQFNKSIYLGITHAFSKINYESDAFSDIDLNSIKASVIVTTSRLKARKNIFTHLGLYSNWAYENSLNHSNLSLLSLKNSIALPGLFANHNVVLDADFQINQNHTQFNFTDNFNYTRGYQSVPFPKDAYRLGFNYHFPLLYPDKGALGIAYLLRTRMNLFFDYSQITAFSNNSIGAELIFDLRLLNSFNGTIGFRVSHLLDDAKSKANTQTYELFIPLNRF